jgi:hypothetical protein
LCPDNACEENQCGKQGNVQVAIQHEQAPFFASGMPFLFAIQRS